MGRDIQAVKISGRDRRVYDDKLRRSLDALSRMLREGAFAAGPAQVGLEVELHLVGEQAEPSLRNEQVLDAITDPDWETELGQFNLEVNVPPRLLSGRALTELEQRLRASFDAADEKARGAGSRLIMIGILPTLGEQHMRESSLSPDDRYRVLNEQILAARGEDVRIEIDGAGQLLTYTVALGYDATLSAEELRPFFRTLNDDLVLRFAGQFRHDQHSSWKSPPSTATAPARVRGLIGSQPCRRGAGPARRGAVADVRRPTVRRALADALPGHRAI